MPHPDVQRARVNIRWKREKDRKQSVNAKAQTPRMKADDYTALMEKIAALVEMAAMLGLGRQLKLPAIRPSGGVSEPDGAKDQGCSPDPLIPDPTLSLFDRALRRIQREENVPEGYWNTQLVLAVAAQKETIEELAQIEGEAALVRRGILLSHLIKNLADVAIAKGETGRRIRAEEEAQMEEVADSLSDEEIATRLKEEG